MRTPVDPVPPLRQLKAGQLHRLFDQAMVGYYAAAIRYLHVVARILHA